MKVVITGAAGFLGREVVRQMLSAGHALTLLGRDHERLAAAFGGTSCRLAATDYRPSHLASLCASCEALVHLAAKRHRRDEPSLQSYLDNIRITENLLGAAEAAEVPAFVFASTCAVYAPEINGTPFREDDRVSPRSPYAITKCVGEMLGRARRTRFVALRFAQLLGWGEREGFLVSTFLTHALHRRTLTVFGEGLCRREYLYVKDAARAVALACAAPRARGILNIGSGAPVSVREFAEEASRVLSDGRSPVVLEPARGEEPPDGWMDISRARETLGWSPSYAFIEALQDIRTTYDAGTP